MHGIPKGETTVTSVAGGGTFLLEVFFFQKVCLTTTVVWVIKQVDGYVIGVLSQFRGDDSFYNAAKKAAKALWEYRSKLNLIGNHIDIGRTLVLTLMILLSHRGMDCQRGFDWLWIGFLLRVFVQSLCFVWG